jgi:cell division protein FtsX
MFALKLALRPWRLQPLSQILSFATLGILFLLAGFFGSLATALPELRKGLEGDQIASVFLDPASEPANLDTVRDQIRLSLGSSAVQVDYVDSDAFLATLQQNQPDLAKEVAALGNEKDWVTPRHFSLRGSIGDKVIERLRAIPGVESVSFSARRFQPIVENLTAIGWLSRVLFSAIILAMVAVLILLGRLNASIFTEAEGIVSQMGGSPWQARLPARLNPILLSTSAGLVAGLAFYRLNPWFAVKMATLSPFFSGLGTTATPLFSVPLLLGLGMAVGAVAFLLSPRSDRAIR